MEVLTSLTPIDLAWMAGLFEGEGTVTIIRDRHRAKLMASMTSTDRQIVEIFQLAWGGYLYERTHIGGKARPATRWQLHSGFRVAVLAEQLLPYVRTSRVRDKMLLIIEAEIWQRKNQGAPDYLARSNEYRARMALLNKRGID